MIRALLPPLIFGLLGYGLLKALWLTPDLLPGLSRESLVSLFSASAGVYLLLMAGGSLFFLSKVKPRWRQLLGGVTAAAVLGALAVTFAWQRTLFPDEFCLGFTMATFPQESAYRVLQETRRDGFRYTLYFDRKGYGGDSPLPMIGVDYEILGRPRVRRCRHRGTHFEHWWDESDAVEIRSAGMDLGKGRVTVRFRDGKRQVFRMEKPLPVP